MRENEVSNMPCKKNLFLAVLFLLTCVLVGCSTERQENDDTYPFTDSAGRTVELPKHIERIAPSGGLAQVALFAVAPDALVGVAGKWKDAALPYIGTKYADLPVFGQFYGMKNLNKEAILSANPQVIIDVGEKKPTIAEDMDGIQAALGIPVIFVEARLDNTDEAYRTLGKVLGREQEGLELAGYCSDIYHRTMTLASQIEKKPRLLYVAGANGNMAVVRGSFHAQVLDLLADNVADAEQPTNGAMSQVSYEQILAWNPDVLLIGAETEIDPAALPWRELSAVKNGKVLRVPAEPYDWMGRPPSVNRFMGMIWLAVRLYPQESGFDLRAETKRYYRLFYHYELDDAGVDVLLAKERVLR
ncbi:periplasmic binding protein [Selenomonas sp. oral taxon 137 str. F0430]|jgi:hypothetical protein|nr:periplasmic binding protein [Selenomonas sp. oral taxon 137 str. F0430]